MPNVERLEAKGSRGEAVVILRVLSPASPSHEASESQTRATFRLATGEALKATDDPRVFETRDGMRKFTLR